MRKFIYIPPYNHTHRFHPLPLATPASCSPVESGWNVWVWLVGVVSRRQVWLMEEGGIYGCGCKEVRERGRTCYKILMALDGIKDLAC